MSWCLPHRCIFAVHLHNNCRLMRANLLEIACFNYQYCALSGSYYCTMHHCSVVTIKYSCCNVQGSGKDLIQPVLDNQLKAASPLLVPAKVVQRLIVACTCTTASDSCQQPLAALPSPYQLTLNTACELTHVGVQVDLCTPDERNHRCSQSALASSSMPCAGVYGVSLLCRIG